MTEHKTPEQILSQAGSLIDEGWCQLAYREDNLFCSMGAINWVTWGYAEPLSCNANTYNVRARREAIMILADQVTGASVVEVAQREAQGDAFSLANCWVITWNDMDHQTKDEVVHQFQLAAKVASGE
jgi:hypothetical protein